MVLKRQQAITWTCDNQLHGCIHAMPISMLYCQWNHVRSFGTQIVKSLYEYMACLVDDNKTVSVSLACYTCMHWESQLWKFLGFSQLGTAWINYSQGFLTWRIVTVNRHHKNFWGLIGLRMDSGFILLMLTLCVLFFLRERKYVSTFCVIPPHSYDTGSWNPYLGKTRTYLLYIYVYNIYIYTSSVSGVAGPSYY